IAESIVNSYLEGPGMRFRKFAQWAEDSDYNDTIGLVTGTILTGDSIDTEALLDEIPVTPGSVPSLQSAKIGEDDYTYWADQWVSENYPDRLSTDYVSDFDEAANLITITWEDESSDSFTPVNYDPQGNYLYAVYTELLEEEVMPVVEGDVQVLDPEDDFPDTTGWTEISYEEVDDEIHGVWERSTYMGQADDRDATYTLK